MKYLMCLAAMLTAVACNGNQANTQAADEAAADSTTQADSKVLVVYFSHPGDNYAVGNVPVGNTKIVADYISELTGAPQFEVVCEKDYNMAYKPLCDLAKKEQEDGELPAFKGKIDNIDQYETIFIGSPVWWFTWPQVMFTFFSKYDLNGKTLIPFTTHEGSGLGRCVTDLKKAYPKANIVHEFSMYGHEVREGKAEVERWLKGIEL